MAVALSGILEDAHHLCLMLSELPLFSVKAKVGCLCDSGIERIFVGTGRGKRRSGYSGVGIISANLFWPIVEEY